VDDARIPSCATTSGRYVRDVPAVRDVCEEHKPHLVLLPPNSEAGHVALRNEARDTLVARRRVNVGHDQKDARLSTVGDPHLVAVDLHSGEQ
jgi:hypothetical protein